MKRDSLDSFDVLPEDMINYLRYMVDILIINFVVMQFLE